MSNSLIDFYKSGISQPALKEGVYVCTLKSHQLVATKPENPYIALEFLTENGRTLRENRFNNGFQIFISHLKTQLGREDEEVNVQDFLNGLIENQTKFRIWITKYIPSNGGQTRSNFNFLEPRKNTETGIKVSNIDDKQNARAEEEVKDDLTF